MISQDTIDTLNDYGLLGEDGTKIDWANGQLEIIDSILQRGSPKRKRRVQIIAATQYGKSLSVGAGLAIRASLKPEKWSIVAGTKEKSRIIMEYVTMFSLDNPVIKLQLDIETPLERLRMRRSQDRLSYKSRGEVRVFSADASKITQVSKSLMGFGSANVVEDESALIPDNLQATVMRMLGGHKDNFLMKVGNPFNRNHFLRTWQSDRYHKVFIDYKRALKEGRFTKEFIEEMREEAMFDILYDCRFPDEGMIDEKGWIPLLTDKDVETAFIEDTMPFGQMRLGCDVSGGGRNFSVMVLRATNLAKVIYKKKEPDTMTFATDINNTIGELNLKSRDVFIDMVGVGRGAADKIKGVRSEVVAVNAGESANESIRFANLRAEMYWKARDWIVHGGKLVANTDWFQLSKIKYKVDPAGRLKIMGKEEMLRNGIDSPDVADSLALTFARVEDVPQVRPIRRDEQEINPDPYEYE